MSRFKIVSLYFSILIFGAVLGALITLSIIPFENQEELPAKPSVSYDASIRSFRSLGSTFRNGIQQTEIADGSDFPLDPPVVSE